VFFLVESQFVAFSFIEFC